MKKGTHKVNFIAEVPQATRVKFKTHDGENVSFIAKKEQPTRVQFWARDRKK